MGSEFSKANLKTYFEEIGLGSYTDFLNVYDDEDEEIHENFNALWIREVIGNSISIGNLERKKIKYLELHSYHENFDAHGEVERLLETYATRQPAVYSFDCSDFTGWTTGGTPTVVSGAWVFDADADTATYDDLSTLLATAYDELIIQYDVKFSNVTNLNIFFKLLRNAAAPNDWVVWIYSEAGKLYVLGDDNEITKSPISIDTYYTVKMVITLSTMSYDIYIDGTKVLTGELAKWAPEAIYGIVFMGDTGTSTTIDNVILSLKPHVNLDNYMKPIEITSKWLSKDGHPQHHWRYTFEVTNWGEVVI